MRRLTDCARSALRGHLRLLQAILVGPANVSRAASSRPALALAGLVVCSLAGVLPLDRAASQDDATQESSLRSAEAVPPAEGVDLYGDPLPEGALVRLGTVRYRQGTGAGEAVFLDDGRTIIVGCENQGARLIDVTTGRTIGTIDFREFQVRRVMVSGDGARLAFAGTQYVPGIDLSVHHLAFWDRAAGGVLSRVQWNSNEGGELRAGCFAPEGNVAALGLSDGSVRVVDVETGLTLKSRQIFTGDDFYNLAGVSFSRNGERLAAVGEHGCLVWDWLEEGVPRSLPGYVGRARSAAFSPDGQRLAVGLEAHGPGSVFLRLYDAHTLRMEREFRSESQHYQSNSIAFTRDGSRLAVGVHQPGAIEIWDVEAATLRQRLALAIDSPRALFVSPDDHRIGCTTGDPALPIWDLRTGQPAASTFEGHDDVPSSVEFTPDGQSVVTAGNDPFAMVWDAVTGNLQHRLTHGLGKWVRGMALSPDGQAIATSSVDDTVRIWDRRTGELKYTLFGHGESGGTRAVRFTPDGSRLLSWGDDLFLRIFDARTGKALQEHPLRPAGMTVQLDEDRGVDQGPAAPFHHFEGAAFTRDGTRLILSTRTVFVFDVETGRQLQQFPERNLVGGLALAPDDTRLALVERGPNRETPLPGGRIQFETSRTQTLKLLSLSTGDVVQEWPLPDGYTARIAYSGDGRRVAVAIHDTTWSAHVYDTESGSEIAAVETKDQEIRGLAVSPDGGGLATALGDATVVIWDLAHFQSAGP